MSTTIDHAAKRKADTIAQEAAGLKCPLPPVAGETCPVTASLEICAGRGIVQFTCQACGGGCAQAMSRETAELLLEEMHAHREPPLPAEATTDEPPAVSLDGPRRKKKRDS